VVLTSNSSNKSMGMLFNLCILELIELLSSDHHLVGEGIIVLYA
jgi:hypothetical protein